MLAAPTSRRRRRRRHRRRRFKMGQVLQVRHVTSSVPSDPRRSSLSSFSASVCVQRDAKPPLHAAEPEPSKHARRAKQSYSGNMPSTIIDSRAIALFGVSGWRSSTCFHRLAWPPPEPELESPPTSAHQDTTFSSSRALRRLIYVNIGALLDKTAAGDIAARWIVLVSSSAGERASSRVTSNKTFSLSLFLSRY